MEKINDNAYKIDLPGEYNISSPFDVDANSRINLFKEGQKEVRSHRNGSIEGGSTHAQIDHLHISDGLITRSREKKIKLAFQGYIQHFLDDKMRVHDKAY